MQPIVIAVAGGTASGKTTVASEVFARVGAEHIAYIPHDAYYRDLSHLSPSERAQVNFDHPNSLETELLIQHVRELRAGRAVEIPVYDFTTHTRRRDTRRVEPA
jgi:uridine kinase